jgi:hypothetical protein
MSSRSQTLGAASLVWTGESLIPELSSRLHFEAGYETSGSRDLFPYLSIKRFSKNNFIIEWKKM